MWQDIGIGAALLVCVGALFKYMLCRMDNKLAKVQTKETCQILHDRIVKDVDACDEKHDSIIKELQTQGKLLASMDSSFKLYREFMEKQTRKGG